MKGYVYILTNKENPGICKIGETHKLTPSQRAKRNNHASTVGVWKLFYSVPTRDCQLLEKMMHEEYQGCKLDGKRELFKASPDDIKKSLISMNTDSIESIRKIKEELSSNRESDIMDVFDEMHKGVCGGDDVKMIKAYSDNKIACFMMSDKRVKQSSEGYELAIRIWGEKIKSITPDNMIIKKVENIKPDNGIPLPVIVMLSIIASLIIFA